MCNMYMNYAKPCERFEKLALKIVMRAQRGENIPDIVDEMCEKGVLKRDPEAIKALTHLVLFIMERWEFA